MTQKHTELSKEEKAAIGKALKSVDKMLNYSEEAINLIRSDKVMESIKPFNEILKLFRKESYLMEEAKAIQAAKPTAENEDNIGRKKRAAGKPPQAQKTQEFQLNQAELEVLDQIDKSLDRLLEIADKEELNVVGKEVIKEIEKKLKKLKRLEQLEIRTGNRNKFFNTSGKYGKYLRDEIKLFKLLYDPIQRLKIMITKKVNYNPATYRDFIKNLKQTVTALNQEDLLEIAELKK